MSRRLAVFTGALAGLIIFIDPTAAAAHAFGQRYDLPLPLSYYVVGAGSVVALSFVIMALFVREHSERRQGREWALSDKPILSLSCSRPVVLTLQILSVALFCLILVTGLFGTISATRNFAPTFIWVIWWVGLAYVQALFGNLWAVINPWDVLFSWTEALWRRIRPAGDLSLNLPYPDWLGCWPALVLFFCFAWLETVSSAAENPRALAAIILGYSLFTWSGMALFGRKVWLTHGEAFTLVFGLMARFAPFRGRLARIGEEPLESDSGNRASLALRPYGVGLLVERPLRTSVICLVILMLATVTFDGFRETQTWADFLDWIVRSESLRGTLLALQGAGFNLLGVIQTLGLIATPLLFCLVYALFSQLTAWAGGTPEEACVAAGAFVLTLVPIAFAYHLAHYFSFLLFAGQLIIPLASDPFGFGWNLFGGANHVMDIGLISMRTIWYVAMGAVVIGHVYAVYLAHVMALHLYAHGRAAILSQLPLTALMVAYTMISLWILSQPIVETG